MKPKRKRAFTWKWHPVSSPPNNSDTVLLACLPSDDYSLGFYWGKGFRTIDTLVRDWRVTHWVSLPDLPKRRRK